MEEYFCDDRKQNAGQWIRGNTSGIGADMLLAYWQERRLYKNQLP